MWGRVDLNYDPDEARKEQEKLREEFARNCQIASENPDWPSNLCKDEWPRPPSSKVSQRAWVEIKGGLRRKVQPTKQGRRVRFGDTVAARLACSSQNEVFSSIEDGRFLVGALAIPRWLSCAAASLVEGERGDFEADDAALPARFAVEGLISFELEILEIVAVVQKTEDASGRLGQGSVLKQTLKDGEEHWRRPTARSDITYSLQARYVPTGWCWPGDDDAVLLVGGCTRESMDETIESRACADPMQRKAEPLRVAAEACAKGETAIVALLDEAFELSLIDFCEVEDCFPERAGAISKKIIQAPDGSRAVPSDLDVVVVRGVVKARDSGTIACAYGTGEGTVSWRLDEDASATFDSASELKAPLCRGIELAIRRMSIGETADVTIHAPDLCFVRPPSTACAPTAPRIDDLQAFHYGGDRGALSAVADSRCYSCPLQCRLELVAIQRFNASSDGDALQRCEARLALAEDAKQRGSQHYDRSAFARASRRYGDALRQIEDAADALEHFENDPENEFDPSEPSRYCKAALDPIIDTPSSDFDYEDLPRPPTFDVPDVPKAEDSLREKRNRRYAELQARCLELERLCRLNRAACDLKRCEYQRVCDDCHSVLKDDPEDLKALFRGGKALVGIKDYDGARSLFHRCLDVDADCKDAEKMLRHVAKLEAGNGTMKGAFPPARGLGFNRRPPEKAGVAHDRPDVEGEQGGSKRASSMVDEADLPFKARANGSAHALREMRAMLDDDGVD
ncbi:unnamed protein product [Pelagomonas calceolata]|uniref:Peptidylprolyl isomerase n=1 Tax=Pelagomonas calceolata TaxID=35677 RepID=A0A8J2WTB5_9STRA|nr:unnamed protein product [Pelagomonas calceolata]|mmetsp:Transcript_4002/g.11359  ORF Transcript_4002/g.11359 Transcript_4002/m.11359 type:complete len:742 (-) Transcript_4002:17-2242(-)